MIVYKDRNTGAELFTDSFKFQEIDEVIYECDGKIVSLKSDTSNIDIGANASAEDEAESFQDGAAVTGVDVILHNRLQKMDSPYSFADYIKYLKEYFKTLDFPEGKTDEYKKKIQTYILAACGKKGQKFGDFDQYTGADSDIGDKPMIVLLNYRPADDTPYVVYIKHGLDAVKF